MGLGNFKNGRHRPITSYEGSWAWKQEQRKRGMSDEEMDAELAKMKPTKPVTIKGTPKTPVKITLKPRAKPVAESATTATHRAVLAEMAEMGDSAPRRLTEIENPMVADSSTEMFVSLPGGKRGKVIGYTPSLGSKQPAYWHVLPEGAQPGQEVGVRDAQIIA